MKNISNSTNQWPSLQSYLVADNQVTEIGGHRLFQFHTLHLDDSTSLIPRMSYNHLKKYIILLRNSQFSNYRSLPNLLQMTEGQIK